MYVRVWEKSIQDDRLRDILKSSVIGLPKGWTATIEPASEYTKGADIDVIFGSWKDYDVEHHNLKREIVKNSKNILIIETPLLGRGPVSEVCQDSAFRVGLNGFMAKANWAKIDSKRVEKIRKTFKIPEYVPENTQLGNYILIPLQLPGDASLQGTNINDWMEKTVREIRNHTDRKIVLRMPQIERNYDLQRIQDVKEIYYQKGTYGDKQVTLDNAYAVVTYSSGMSVEALLNGNRVYVESNDGFKSPSQSSLEQVLQPDYRSFKDFGDYERFFNLVASTYWTAEEIKKGLFWDKFNYAD